MKKSILLCLTVFLINFIISCKDEYILDDCGGPYDPINFTFTGIKAFNSSSNSSTISVFLEGEENDEVVFRLNGLSQMMACTPKFTYIYQDTLQELKVYLNSNGILSEISDEVLILPNIYISGTTLEYNISSYLDIPTDDTEDEASFRIYSKTENLIHSDSSYRVLVKYSNNEEEYFVDLSPSLN